MKIRFYQRFAAAIVAALMLTAVFAATSFTNVSAQGTVVEGDSIPVGITLNSTRADVEAAIGRHQYCQLPNQNFCNYAQGIQIVYVDRPEAPDNSIVRITYGNKQWRTTNGATLQLLQDDPLSLISLYPTAQVSGDPNNPEASVEVNIPELGIRFDRVGLIYSPDTVVSATIFQPSGGNPAPQPQPQPQSVVTLYDGIGFTQGKKGSFEFGIGTVAGKHSLGDARLASSVRVPDGLRVTLCSNRKGTKNCQTLTEDKRRLQRGLRNKVRFVQVTDSSQALSAAALNSVQTAENFELLYLPTMVQQ